MMVITHIFVSLLLSTPFLFLFPEHTSIILISASAGGFIPDLDLLVGEHRRTLHFPFLSWIIFIPLLVGSVVTSSPLLTFMAVFSLGFASHSLGDIFGGGLEKRPWEQTSDRAVYSHLTGKWIAPKYYVSYDGSYGDLIISVITAIPILYIVQSKIFVYFIVFGLIIGSIYVISRKSLPQIEDYIYTNHEYLKPFLRTLH